MGQVLRRATSRVRSSSIESSAPLKKAENRPQAVRVEPEISKNLEGGTQDPNAGDTPQINPDNILEDKDPGYDVMLSQMVGRIRSKPGGRLEMGEASVVERYQRPMPKLRNTKPESSQDMEKSVPPGTLNAAQLRQIFLLHQGKSEDHDGPMDAHQIAEKFRIDSVQVERILQFLSLPPEAGSKRKDKN